MLSITLKVTFAGTTVAPVDYCKRSLAIASNDQSHESRSRRLAIVTMKLERETTAVAAVSVSTLFRCQAIPGPSKSTHI